MAARGCGEATASCGVRLAEILEAHYRAHPEQRPADEDRTDWAPGFYAVQVQRDRALSAVCDSHEGQVRAQSWRPTMLEAISLTKKYGAHRALDALTLRVDPGEVFCQCRW